MTPARFAMVAGLWRELPVFDREELAADPLTPPDVLAGLTGDPSLLVRRAVDANPSTPAGVVVQLDRRRRVWEDDITPPHVLQKMAEADDPPGDGRRVWTNPVTPAHVLRQLAEADNPPEVTQ